MASGTARVAGKAFNPNPRGTSHCSHPHPGPSIQIPGTPPTVPGCSQPHPGPSIPIPGTPPTVPGCSHPHPGPSIPIPGTPPTVPACSQPHPGPSIPIPGLLPLSQPAPSPIQGLQSQSQGLLPLSQPAPSPIQGPQSQSQDSSHCSHPHPGPSIPIPGHLPLFPTPSRAFNPIPRTSPTVPGCSQPHPGHAGALPGMEQSQLPVPLWFLFPSSVLAWFCVPGSVCRQQRSQAGPAVFGSSFVAPQCSARSCQTRRARSCSQHFFQQSSGPPATTAARARFLIQCTQADITGGFGAITSSSTAAKGWGCTSQPR
ncbi:basic proline-rich protein-like [Serinus canaria]|uniref:basic proline-rich protein-like n=1 Tax=Serinus canaria TaxID=9135 RepID=UPI0021CC6DD7|nr:basic proline-rich protein-like [Serinus canaria]